MIFRIIRFFTRGPGVALIVVGITVAVGTFIQHSREKQEAKDKKNQVKRELGTVNPRPSVDTSKAAEETFLSKRQLVPGNHSETEDPIKSQNVFTPPAHKPMQQLVSFYSQVAGTPTPAPAPKEPVIETIWLPPSSFIPCILVNTVESSHINTPVVGEVLEDVYNNGHLVIAAGTIVSSFAQSGAIRDRIEVAGEWLLVFHDGRQLKVNGIACVRQANPQTQQFGPEDGSAGLLGTLEESDHWSNAKAFVALLATATIQGGTAAVSSKLSSGYGGGVGLPDTTPVLSKYLDQLLNGSTGDARYVRVTSGTEFYIFPSETVLPLKRTIDNKATTKDPETAQSTDPLQQMQRRFMESLPQATPNENRPNFKY